jgi:hypothetical protein
MSASLRLREISPPPIPRLGFRFWRELPKWRRPFGCPDCRKTFVAKGALPRHLRLEHPRWRLFIEAFEEMRRPPPIDRQDPAYRARMSEASRRAWADPAVRARMSEASRRALADPAVRARISEASRRALADPAVRARMSEARRTGRGR